MVGDSQISNRKKQTRDLNDSQLMEQGLWEPGQSDQPSSKTRSGLHYTALPFWLQDNSFLQRGHRPPSPSVKECIKSIFHIHTETGNIWTHLVGCVIFIALAIYFLTTQPRKYIKLSFQDKIICGTFFVGVIICLFLSSAYHTLRCHSPRVGRLWHKLDYVGISILIMASYVPWLHYGFYCQPSTKLIYMSITFFLGLLTIICSLFDVFAQPAFRPIRAGLFILFGLSGVVPGVHYLMIYGWHHAITRASFGWLLLMGFLYIVGAVFYASRVPEKYFPGSCDIWGQSHQLFHILVVVAAVVHFYGISQMVIHRRMEGECGVRNNMKPHRSRN